MKNIEKVRITQLATEFRNACEIFAFTTNDAVLKSFPLGCCGDVSEMLECYLYENGIRNIHHISATKRNSFQTHAWSEIGSMVIDITNDQFSYGQKSVYIGHPLFYRLRYKCERSKGYVSPYDTRLESIYSSIKKIIEDNKKSISQTA